jgi:hypothetical protein
MSFRLHRQRLYIEGQQSIFDVMSYDPQFVFRFFFPSIS